LDFFFGPCLDNSAVDQRQNQPRPQRPQHQQSQQKRQQRERHYNTNNGNRPSRSRENRLIYPPTIPENGEQRMNSDDGEKNNRRNGSNLRNSGTNGGLRNSGTKGTSSNGHHKSRSHTHYSNNTGISSLSDSFGGKRRYRRDDASTLSASLFDTYQVHLTDDPEDFLDEQSVIRRSLKDNIKTTKKMARSGRPPKTESVLQNEGNKRRQSSNNSQVSGKTELESWIEHKDPGRSATGKSPGRGGDQDTTFGRSFDNVTTISKASKNPYKVLGISQSASPKEIYSTYKRRMIEAKDQGGGAQAFTDVGNAYRRLRADIKRQEARKERRRMERQGGGKTKKSNHKDLSYSSDEDSDAKTRRENIDARLKDHRELVQDLFANDNPKRNKKSSVSSVSSVSSRGQVTTLNNSVQRQSQALSVMNLVPVEGGASNINEQNETIKNSCFYLSLAASYLSGVGAFVEDPTASYYLNTMNSGQSVATVEMEIATLASKERKLTMNLALQLKRAIEAAVLLVHPDWANSGMVGEEVQAFSDFLVYALDSDSVLGHWAIAVFDEASGFVDIYRGRHYGKIYPPTEVKIKRGNKNRSRGGRDNSADYHRTKLKYKDCDEVTKRANTLTLRYIPGHYQPLLPELTKIVKERRRQGDRCLGLQQRAMLEDILSTLEKWNVLHVVTDGRA